MKNRPWTCRHLPLALPLLTAFLLYSGCATRERPGAIVPNPETTGLPQPTPYSIPPPHGPAHPAPDGASALTALTAVPRGEELWLIARGDQPPDGSTADQPGAGSLLATVGKREIPMPLKHTDVRASISGYIAAVDVTQQFQNPYSSKIEAVYVFPLPHDSAVSEFVMTIGDRRIRGIIRERKEAEELYAQARQQGFVASLLTEERPNVFRQSVANIEPGKQIDVSIRYFHTLAFVDGWYEFVFPMVVGPRFNPAGSTNGIGAVAREHRGGSGQPVDVRYLKPRERTRHDISLRVEIDAGTPIEEIACPTHEIERDSPAPERATASLSPVDSIPNKDFVLRYRVAGERIKSGLLTHRGERGNYFTLMLLPPRELGRLTRQPVEMVFVIDCSGSMDGRPIQQAKAAVERGLRLLKPGDSFQVISFSMSASQLGEGPLEVTSQNIRQAIQYVRGLNGEGGTMMIEGIKAALDFPHDPQRLRFVCFLTDGFIGNETEITRAIHERLGPSRIFSFGIGSSVNRYLIEQMGATGRGAVAYLGLRDEAAQIMEDFFARISHPALTDLRIDWAGAQVSEVFPRQLPDLFAGRPVILTGRFTGELTQAIRVVGRAAGEEVTLDIPTSDPATNSHPGLPSVWARSKIADLAEQAIFRPDSELPAAIKTVALDYGLLSAFTAFVAVDSTRRTEGTESTTVPVAVPVPEGAKYKTTVPEK
jgi:Ca-activated chloride channel family protein